ncbi:MAG: hypothetical protein MUP26_04655, partial [Desulfobulbaceae bacterium]|nr:hypothetical protein [Desulfobulbaceae bacterium]
PIAVPYASKGYRFMKEAGIAGLTVDASLDNWDEELSVLLDRTWDTSRDILQALTEKRSELAEKCTLNLELFRQTCIQS